MSRISLISLARASVPGIMIFVGGWICVTGIQHDDGFFSLSGLFIILLAAGIWVWNEDAMRGAYPFRY